MKRTSLASNMVTDLACARFPPGTPVSRIPNGELVTESVRGGSEGPSGEPHAVNQSRDIKKREGEGGGGDGVQYIGRLCGGATC